MGPYTVLQSQESHLLRYGNQLVLTPSLLVSKGQLPLSVIGSFSPFFGRGLGTRLEPCSTTALVGINHECHTRKLWKVRLQSWSLGTALTLKIIWLTTVLHFRFQKNSLGIERGSRGGSASTRILYTYTTSFGDIRYDNRSYAVVIQRKSCARRQISAPSIPSCAHANDLSLRYVYFRWSRVHTVVETAVTAPVGVWEHCKRWVQLQASETGEIQAPIAHERGVL